MAGGLGRGRVEAAYGLSHGRGLAVHLSSVMRNTSCNYRLLVGFRGMRCDQSIGRTRPLSTKSFAVTIN